MALLDLAPLRPGGSIRSGEPRVAIVSDPLVQRGGAERCVEVMAQTFPEAPIFALLYSRATGPASLEERIVSSPLQRIPGASLALTLLPCRHRVVRSVRLRRHPFLAPYGGERDRAQRRSDASLLLPHPNACALGAAVRGDPQPTAPCASPGRGDAAPTADVGLRDGRARGYLHREQRHHAASDREALPARKRGSPSAHRRRPLHARRRSRRILRRHLAAARL